MIMRRIIAMLVFTMLALVEVAVADEAQSTMQDWLNTTQKQGTIPPGTRITMQNWQNYKQFMPVGMIYFFEGRYFWKMPSDVEMPVGPTVTHPLPKTYIDVTEKYSEQVQVVHYPDGSYNLNNYVGGLPFPNPQEPDRGYKILANEWFGYVPHLLVVAKPFGWASFCTVDRFTNINCQETDAVYRQLAYNTDPGIPATNPQAAGSWYTQWIMVETPEQSKYTAVLTIFPQDLTKLEDHYVFVPALRRSLRLSSSSRCAPLLGSDMVNDDSRVGYDGGLHIFDSKYLGERKILALTDVTAATGKFPANYGMRLGWSMPSWGNWSLRDVDVLDIRRIPSQRQGYCYGAKIMYVDTNFWHPVWEESYDTNLKLWKIVAIHPAVVDVAEIGKVTATLTGIEEYWDVQNDHASHIYSANPDGKTQSAVYNQQAPPEYDNVTKFSTPAGLMQILR
jgi:uncharacterized protein DUF1329